MKFDNIIMNPPFCNDLHLKVLTGMLKLKSNEGEIVNLSPCSWLQDVSAQDGKNTWWHRYSKLRKSIDKLDVVTRKYAAKMFKILPNTDMGIYSINEMKGTGFPYEFDPIVVKMYNKIKTMENMKKRIDFNKVDGIRVRGRGFIQNGVNHSAVRDFFSINPITCPEIVYINGYTRAGEHWAAQLRYVPKEYNFDENSPLSASIKFDTYEEAYNFQRFTRTRIMAYFRKLVKVSAHEINDLTPDFAGVHTDKIDGWHKHITDEILKDFFGITDEEYKYICDYLAEQLPMIDFDELQRDPAP